jgi:dTDP-4-dehydrorhamnose reductase
VKILLTGRNGQVGGGLARALAPLGEVLALDRSALDLGDAAAIRRVVRQARADILVNAAAYTAVDRAESETEIASRINGAAPAVLAEEARQSGALLVHYSTDYVFDGEKNGSYTEKDPPHPANAYGRSKLEGEIAIQSSGCRHLILRTSWVYSSRGNNFLRTILRLARERSELRVVDDQVGAPTSAIAIARATAAMLRDPDPTGLFHMSAAGSTSWHGFAQAILEEERLSNRLIAIRSEEYPSAARRPRNSRLDNSRLRERFGIVLEDWRTQLREVLAQPSGDYARP